MRGTAPILLLCAVAWIATPATAVETASWYETVDFGTDYIDRSLDCTGWDDCSTLQDTSWDRFNVRDFVATAEDGDDILFDIAVHSGWAEEWTVCEYDAEYNLIDCDPIPDDGQQYGEVSHDTHYMKVISEDGWDAKYKFRLSIW